MVWIQTRICVIPECLLFGLKYDAPGNHCTTGVRPQLTAVTPAASAGQAAHALGNCPGPSVRIQF